jgi:endonuclease YncB( thermonuclease family)
MAKERAQDRRGKGDEAKGMIRPGGGRKPRGGPLRAPRVVVHCPGESSRPLRLMDLLGPRARRALIALLCSTFVGFGAAYPQGAVEIPISFSALFDEAPKSLASNRVVRVIDGDTVDLNRGGEIVRCRLIGIDAPESTTKIEPYGPEASRYLRAWIEGKVVRVDYERREKRGGWERDRYGRLLVYLLADHGRQSINIALVENGQARYEAAYPTRYRAQLKAAETDARAHKRGLWASSGVAARPSWRVTRASVPRDRSGRWGPIAVDPDGARKARFVRPTEPVPPRPPGWGGNWPPSKFRDIDENLDCLEFLLRMGGYPERWKLHDDPIGGDER